DRRLDVARDTRAARSEDRVHLVEEDDDRQALLASLLRPLEDLPDLPLRFADVLVEQFRALDVQEVGVRVVASRSLAHLVGEGLRNGLSDQRLSATRRPVEQDSLRRLEMVFGEELGVQKRQLDGVADRLDLA